MSASWQIVLGVVAGIVCLYLALLAVLWRAQRHGNFGEIGLREALRLLPDMVRLLKRLAADRALPRGVRWRIALLLVYLASPIDLVPDVIPVLGFLDDAIIVALTLRSVTRRAGVEAIERHWPGTPDGLRVICQLAGLTSP